MPGLAAYFEFERLTGDLWNVFEYVAMMHHWRFFGTYAAPEILMVLALSLFMAVRDKDSRQSYRTFGYNTFYWIYVFVLLGIFAHWRFGVNTLLNWQIGLSECYPDFDSLTGIFECVCSAE